MGRQVDAARTSIGGILTQAQRVSQLVGELALASTEQSAGFNHVGHAVTQFDQVTQQNGALVEESTAAAASLKHQAAQLVDVARVFEVGAGSTVPGPGPG